MYAVSFQSPKGYDVAVDPHMLEFYHSQIEDIEIQGKLHTQQQLLDFENHFEAVSSGNIVDIALPAYIGTLLRVDCLKLLSCKILIDLCGKYTTLFLFCNKPI